jgi:hypothetical protein
MCLSARLLQPARHRSAARHAGLFHLLQLQALARGRKREFVLNQRLGTLIICLTTQLYSLAASGVVLIVAKKRRQFFGISGTHTFLGGTN